MTDTRCTRLLRHVATVTLALGLMACGSSGSGQPTGDAARPVAPASTGGPRQEDLGFTSADGTTLTGTLFLPATAGRHPAVVWVHASGEHERLGEGDLIDAALDAGIAFFSYDKRGVGESGGTCCPADDADAGIAEFGEQADDALAALEAVRSQPGIDAAHVGFLGVSQAGWIVPLAASRSADVAFMVLASGTPLTTGEEGFYSDLTGDADVSGADAAELSRLLVQHGPSGFDPKPYLDQVTVAGLWLFGSADGSIPPAESEAALDRLRAQGKDYSYVEFEGAGHGLLDTSPPPPAEVIPTIVEWVTAATS